MDPDIRTSLLVSFVAFGILYAFLLSQRMAIAKLEEEVEYLEHVVHAA